jgi:hypothetical protein
MRIAPLTYTQNQELQQDIRGLCEASPLLPQRQADQRPRYTTKSKGSSAKRFFAKLFANTLKTKIHIPHKSIPSMLCWKGFFKSDVNVQKAVAPGLHLT